MDLILHWIQHYGYAGIFILLVLGIVGIPIPDEILLLFSGYLVLEGRLNPVLTLGVAVLGSACGITLSYLLGRAFGARLLDRYGPRIHLTPERVDQVHWWFARAGRWALTFGYFLPGVRPI